MSEFESIDFFFIKGRGKVFTVLNDKERDRNENDLMDSIVKIDGKEYTVKGVESFLTPLILVGDKIGILVEDE